MEATVASRSGDRLPTVLILMAAVGGGHEAAARALQSELEPAGYQVVVTDGIRPMSRLMEWNLHTGYAHLLMDAPQALGLFFRMSTNRLGTAITRFLVSRLCADRLLEAIAPFHADVVISTYPFVTAALGYLRQQGKLQVPAVALIDDFGVHRLWVAPNVDMHMVVSRRSVALANLAGGRARLTNLPVDPAFHTAPPRDIARASLGLPATARIALIVGGAWGIGDLEGAVSSAHEAGWYPIVVTGSNKELRDRLELKFPHKEQATIFGWTDDMPLLMAAADCLIQNAGGMTCLEAISRGLPILMYKPIPGHGELNARVMAESGAARLAKNRSELRDVLKRVAHGEIQLEPPQWEQGITGRAVIDDILSSPLPQPTNDRVPHTRALAVGAALPLLSIFARTAWKRRQRAPNDDCDGQSRQAQHE